MPPEPAPLPILATMTGFGFNVTVTFDRPLTPAVIAAAPWGITASPIAAVRKFQPLGNPIAAGFTVTYAAFDSGPDVGFDRIDYQPPPTELFGITGVPVAPFLSFPLTIIP